jgi:DNA excision repair protein ERCC-3
MTGMSDALGEHLTLENDAAPAHFYALVTRDTVDQTFAANRQLFLTEQGFRSTLTDQV